VARDVSATGVVVDQPRADVRRQADVEVRLGMSGVEDSVRIR
jgi:hypothetical protein